MKEKRKKKITAEGERERERERRTEEERTSTNKSERDGRKQNYRKKMRSLKTRRTRFIRIGSKSDFFFQISELSE